jgi:RES domain-containing protein
VTPIRVGPDRVFHRYHAPEWAALPLSGAGAAVNGGRFNRPGVEALYLSVDPATARAEYQQGASITPPGTLVAYRVDVEGVVDFSGGYDPALWPAL